MTEQPVRIIRPHRPEANGFDALVGVPSPPALGLYIHLPWCVRKCPYCDFNSHEWREGASEIPEQDYLDALEADLDWSLPLVWGRTVQSIFIGGGTPSLFSEAGIDRLLAMVRARLRIAADAEVTMEANPGTFELERFKGFANSGINRLSLGIQSFSDRALAAIGRIHDGRQAQDALDAAMNLFPRVNVDLMFALPGQSIDELDSDLRRVAAAGPTHLSVYHLTLEPGTAFAHRPPDLPDERLSDDMQDLIDERAAAMGLDRYEVSALARPGHVCRHNLNYWQFGDYLGIGAGAHGKLSFHDRIIRQSRLRNPRKYMSALRMHRVQASSVLADVMNPLAPVSWIETAHAVTAADLPFEFMLNALRLRDGVPTSLFAERTGLPITRIGSLIGRAVDRGLLSADPGRIQATPLGWRFLNDLQSIFLND